MHLFLQAFTPEINLWESYPLLYVKPTIQKQPGQGHSVLSLQSNTDFPLKGKFSISKDLIVWSFKNNSRCLNFRTEYIPQHKIVFLRVICTNFESLGTAVCFIFRYNLHSVFTTFHIFFSYIWVYSRWTHSSWRITMIDCTTHVDIFLPYFAGFYINLAIVSHSLTTPPSSLWSLCLLKLRLNFIKTNGLLHQEEKNSNTTVIKYITFNWN